MIYFLRMNFEFNMYDLKTLGQVMEIGKTPDLKQAEIDALYLKGDSTHLIKFI